MEFKRKPKDGAPQDVMRVVHMPLQNGEHFPLLTFPALTELSFIRHGFSTRAGGVSRGIFSTLNLSFTRGDDEKAVTENYSRIADALQIDYNSIVCSDQTHTTNVRVVTKADAGKGLVFPKDYTDVDGMVTDVPGITLATFFADCVPLYFADPENRAIGLSHSGWRGTAGRMGEKTLQVMREQFGTRPEDVICAIGPSICRDCYEVSGDVAEIFCREFPEYTGDILQEKGHGKYQLDLWRANEIILLEAGVSPEHISVTDICTCCNPQLLFSHRVSHGKRGNAGAFLGLL